jgi:endonuclease VIII
MPEGPSLVILREAVQAFENQTIIAVSGNLRTFDPELLLHRKITGFKTWGKHFLICLGELTVRVHFLMFGSYTINERKEGRTPRLQLVFRDGELNFYACAVRLLDDHPNAVYDWSVDVMHPSFDKKKALAQLKKIPETLICDALLDQNIFSGVGNIIKNEVLFRTRIHPASPVGDIPLRKKKELIDEAVNYSFQFLEWKKEFTLRAHWQVHTKKLCPRDRTPIVKEYLGKTKRRTFYCPKCQKRYE